MKTLFDELMGWKSMIHTLYRVQERRKRMLGWQCTHKDPFAGEWEQIFYTPSSSASTRSMGVVSFLLAFSRCCRWQSVPRSRLSLA